MNAPQLTLQATGEQYTVTESGGQGQNQSNLLVDSAQGVVTAVTVNETIVSTDESANAPSTGGAVDGVVATSGAKTRGTLRLIGVSDTSGQAATFSAPMSMARSAA